MDEHFRPIGGEAWQMTVEPDITLFIAQFEAEGLARDVVRHIHIH